MMNPPTEDVQFAQKHNFTFIVAQKQSQTQKWEIVAPRVASLGEAVTTAQQLSGEETSVFTADGLQYWSSKTPERFNSAVIQHGQMAIKKFDHFEVIHWRAFFQIDAEPEIPPLLRAFSQAIGQPLKLSSSQLYRQDQTLFEVSFTSPLKVEAVAIATFKTLRFCHKVANRWHVTGPVEYSGGRWEFKGQAATPSLPQVAWIEFSLSNFAYEWAGDSQTELGEPSASA
jgi:hypothetical protein